MEALNRCGTGDQQDATAPMPLRKVSLKGNTFGTRKISVNYYCDILVLGRNIGKEDCSGELNQILIISPVVRASPAVTLTYLAPPSD